MTAPNLVFYPDGGSTPLSGLQMLPKGTPGTAATEATYDLWNDKAAAGVDDATNRFLSILTRTKGQSDFLSAGHEAADDRWFEAMLVSGLGGLSINATPWMPMGSGRDLRLPTIPSARGVKLKIRGHAPGAAATRHVEFNLGISRRLATPLPLGLTEAVGPGLSMGLGDSESSWLLRVGANVVENPGGADEFVQVDDVTFMVEGVPRTVLRQLIELTNADGASATLSSGEAYKALFYAKTDGTIGLAKGLKGASPSNPAYPVDGIPGGALAYVRREFDATVNDADIENVWVCAAGHLVAAGTSGSLGPREALIDNRLIRTQTSDSLTFVDDDTNYVWSLSDGTLAVNQSGDRPQSRASLWWEVVLASGVVTAKRDRRPWLGFGHRIERLDFRFDATIAAAQKRYAPYRGNRRAYIVPLGGIGVYVADSGTASDATIVDVSTRAPGAGSFTTVHTSQGSEDRRATIEAGGAVLESTDALPEVLPVEPDTVFEMEIDQVPETTQPAGAWGSVLLAVA